MYIENKVSVYDFACAIAGVIDLSYPSLSNHHKRVAYISWKIARELSMPDYQTQNIIIGALLHDIGAFSLADYDQILSLNSDPLDICEHAIVGYKLLSGFHPLAEVAQLIRHHHADYQRDDGQVSMGSYIINLADRIAVLYKDKCSPSTQATNLIDSIAQCGLAFHPAALGAFFELATHESFWLGIVSSDINPDVENNLRYSTNIDSMVGFRSFARIVARMIDFRNRFTVTHSNGVAAVAQELARSIGFSEPVCEMAEIAGLLHDLGKLAIPNELFLKAEVLSAQEFETIRQHPYHTFMMLSNIRGMEQTAVWVSHHHERLDGSGYPFNAIGQEFSELSQIMTTADVYTAVLEDRPYRPGKSHRDAMVILGELVDNGGLDVDIVDVLFSHLERIDPIRERAQLAAAREYELFSSLGFLGGAGGAGAGAVSDVTRKSESRLLA